MHLVAGLAGVALVLLMLSELFVSLIVPRRVKRDPRLARERALAARGGGDPEQHPRHRLGHLAARPTFPK